MTTIKTIIINDIIALFSWSLSWSLKPLWWLPVHHHGGLIYNHNISYHWLRKIWSTLVKMIKDDVMVGLGSDTMSSTKYLSHIVPLSNKLNLFRTIQGMSNLSYCPMSALDRCDYFIIEGSCTGKKIGIITLVFVITVRTGKTNLCWKSWLKLLLLESVTNGDGMASFLREGENAKYAKYTPHPDIIKWIMTMQNMRPPPDIVKWIMTLFQHATHKVCTLNMTSFLLKYASGNKSTTQYCRIEALE